MPGMAPNIQEQAHGMVRRYALLAVKSVHTLIFAFMSGSILYTLYCGLTDRVSRRTGIAVAAVIGEAIVYWRNRWRCPLTDVAERLGAENGTVGDLFLPDWFTPHIPVVGTSLFGVGILALVGRRLRAWTRRGHTQ